MSGIFDLYIFDNDIFDVGEYAPFQTTGSNEQPVLCLEEGVQASRSYGVNVYPYGGPCPNCQVSIQVNLDFNPLDAHYYLRCPICNGVWRWLNIDGSNSDFKQVVIPVNNKLIEDYSDGFENNGWL